MRFPVEMNFAPTENSNEWIFNQAGALSNDSYRFGTNLVPLLDQLASKTGTEILIAPIGFKVGSDTKNISLYISVYNSGLSDQILPDIQLRFTNKNLKILRD